MLLVSPGYLLQLPSRIWREHVCHAAPGICYNFLRGFGESMSVMLPRVSATTSFEDLTRACLSCCPGYLLQLPSRIWREHICHAAPGICYNFLRGFGESMSVMLPRVSATTSFEDLERACLSCCPGYLLQLPSRIWREHICQPVHLSCTERGVSVYSSNVTIIGAEL